MLELKVDFLEPGRLIDFNGLLENTRMLCMLEQKEFRRVYSVLTIVSGFTDRVPGFV